MNPISTYRLQFHKEFTFADFEKVIPYIQKLGIKTIYASPVFESTPGSTHGYDGMNPHKINPELGTEQQLRAISKRLKESGISWLQDIVPNHMAFNPDNPWIMDVLEKGRQSVFASYFDIDWKSPGDDGKLMVPFLGAYVENVLEHELKIEYSSGRFVINYYDVRYPLNLRSYLMLLNGQRIELQDIKQLSLQLDLIHQVEDPEIYSSQWNEFLLQLQSLMKNADVRAYVDNCLMSVNSSKERLKHFLDEQHYRLEYWEETDRQINFRRFFIVNGLICLNMHDENVFGHYHAYIKLLVDEGVFDGLRIDHIDGLYDPGRYLEQLRKLVGNNVYITVEKILHAKEKLPQNWPVEGTTGYDFLAQVNNLFTNKGAEKGLTRFYKKLSWDLGSVQQQIHDKKAYILYQHMGGELDNLFHLLLDLTLISTPGNDSADNIKNAIAEFLIHCPVYRYYGNSFPLEASEADAVQSILNQIRFKKSELNTAVGLLEEIFLIKPQKRDEEYNSRALKFYMRCMQFTGPLMAKGVEDTLLYTYNRFIGHNDVGDTPETFGYTSDEFHHLMLKRQEKWPLSINTTSTHDTKRGEDIRARLNVLTEISEEWIEAVNEWRSINRNLSEEINLDPNIEYFIYQTLVGALPMAGQEDVDFERRIYEYLRKALREGKQHSDWASPDEEYEASLIRFVSVLLDKDKPFYRILQKFNRRIADFGIINSLSQLILKFTCPGIPDTYQGCELWDLSLVDPDNRRPVDYEKRLTFLENLDSQEANSAFIQKLWEKRSDGQIKLWLTHVLLTIRNSHPDIFVKGQYLPLEVKGKYKEHVFAFARRYQHEWTIVAVPLHLARLSKNQGRNIQDLNWKNTRIQLPDSAPEEFEHLLVNSKGKTEKELSIKNIFNKVPLAVLRMQHRVGSRGAGILLHITSLPSPFGIGDLGPGAQVFADYLSNSRQKYWQILPLSPTGEGQGYSPYSAISTMAGNPLLISPERLADEGLLTKTFLKQYYLKEKAAVDFAAAEKIKAKIFDEAYHNFCTINTRLNPEFKQFCESQSEWLNDFALYLLLKQHHGGLPWYNWPDGYKLRETEALIQFAEANENDLNKIKWLQFIFDRQWTGLKTYCKTLGIYLLGDLPFYVSIDSSDVWANKEIFSLNDDGQMIGVAGVPPDYFNDNGQLWGMPVFRWDVLKDQNYDWWIKRLKKNMQLYDLLRLDHFRAFSTYWEVPAGEETAINGEWKNGPGADFFQVLQKEFAELPFVAEDLGDVDQAVYDLRDEFNLPGMRVLQFSFGTDQSHTVHSLHNYEVNTVVYTGTHDNNTTQGWLRQDADEIIRKNLEKYTGKTLRKRNIHSVLGKLAYSSVGKIVILPMQDVIGLDEDARMNTPASTGKNWAWRLKSKQMKPEYSKKLREWVKMYNRE
ncbi:malto-oligosyltrehalose synthase [Pedobacter sp. P351]|uniref:malto-oligosyltrehalose synthase n=1 Tax=Pedobacter superstes TaxID=3133441 RepID=UPI003095FFF5